MQLNIVQLYEGSDNETGMGVKIENSCRDQMAIPGLPLTRDQKSCELFNLLDPPSFEVVLRVETIDRSSRIDVVILDVVIGNQANYEVVSPVASPSMAVQSVRKDMLSVYVITIYFRRSPRRRGQITLQLFSRRDSSRIY